MTALNYDNVLISPRVADAYKKILGMCMDNLPLFAAGVKNPPDETGLLSFPAASGLAWNMRDGRTPVLLMLGLNALPHAVTFITSTTEHTVSSALEAALDVIKREDAEDTLFFEGIYMLVNSDWVRI